MEAERHTETSRAYSLYRNRYSGFFTTEILTKDRIHLPQIVRDCTASLEISLILQCQRPTAACPQKPAVDNTQVQLKPLSNPRPNSYYNVATLKLDFNFSFHLTC